LPALNPDNPLAPAHRRPKSFLPCTRRSADSLFAEIHAVLNCYYKLNPEKLKPKNVQGGQTLKAVPTNPRGQMKLAHPTPLRSGSVQLVLQA